MKHVLNEAWGPGVTVEVDGVKVAIGSVVAATRVANGIEVDVAGIPPTIEQAVTGVEVMPRG